VRMKLIPLFLAAVMVAVSGWAEEGGWAEGYTPKPYSPELAKRAEAGDAVAQYRLGTCYYFGQGVAQDYKEAAKWDMKSAEQGNAIGQHYLGWCYYDGKGVTQDYKEAVKWFTKSAEQGNPRAQYYLGTCYYLGQGVTQDYKEAVKWCTKASEQEDAIAKEALEKLKSK